MMTMLVSSNMMASTPELESNATSNAVKSPSRTRDRRSRQREIKLFRY